MAQFNTPKNPPWVRAESCTSYPMQQVSQPVQQQMMAQQLNPAVVQYQQPAQAIYSTQLALQQQAMNMQTMHQMVANNAQQMYNPQITTAAVNRPMNTQYVQPVVGPVQAPQGQNNNSTATKQRVFTGTVTKVVDTYGFVDEDVFFQMTVVKGPTPIVNDRVLVEAVCLPNMPFKWNATRIQVLPMNDPPRSGGGGGGKKGFVVSNSGGDRGGSGYNAVPPPSGEYDERPHSRDDSRDRRDRIRSRERQQQKREEDVMERRRRRERREKEEDDKKRDRERERDKDKEKDKDKERDRGRSKSRSPKKPRVAPIVRKYRVRVPEHPLDVRNFGVSDLRSRYRTMYIPSDLFRTTSKWQDTFPVKQPLTVNRTAQFHVFNKEVESIFEYSDNPEAVDADYTYSAKVMLLSMATMDEMLKKCTLPTEEMEKDDGRGLVHPARLINCLVGCNTRTKSEILPIGGAWSPSLDGADPKGDPNVLIKTAIRTCRALTGIDLSSCTHWYRFVEIFYHRSKSTHKGKEIPARVESVVIYVPDVWSVTPSCLEWDGLHLNYRKQLDKKLAEVGKAEDAGTCSQDDEKDETVPNIGKDPTHYSQLDPKVMKVSELRDELAARGLSPKGLRLQLIPRLTKVLKTEQDASEAEAEKNKKLAYVVTPTEPVKEKDEEEEKKQKELEKDKKKIQKERTAIEERYLLPETPHIVVHPSKTAKGGKFNCKLLSLSLMLDYSVDTAKEHTFEVSLFAELFNEMLMRDFGLQVYRAIYNAPDKKDEAELEKEKKEKEGEKEDEKEKDKDEERKEEKDIKEGEKENKKDDGKEKTDEGGEPPEKRQKTDENLTNGKGDKDKDASDDENSKDSKDTTKERGKDKDKDKDRRDRRKREREREKEKEVPHFTARRDLLLAFAYFDVTHYGRINSTNLEELVHSLGMHLSRSQVKKLVGKVLQREYCDYRKLTDLPVGTTLPETSQDETETSLELGNVPQLPVFQLTPPEKEPPTPVKRGRRAADKVEKEPEKVADGFVSYRGSLVNIENLKAQVTENVATRLETENKLLELKSQLSTAEKKGLKDEEEISSLKKELRMCKAKMNFAVEKLNQEVATSDVYLTALMDVEERLVPILDTDEARRLIKLRQEVVGVPSINLVPLRKVDDIDKIVEEAEEKVKEEDDDRKPDMKVEPMELS